MRIKIAKIYRPSLFYMLMAERVRLACHRKPTVYNIDYVIEALEMNFRDKVGTQARLKKKYQCPQPLRAPIIQEFEFLYPKLKGIFWLNDVF